MKVLIDIDENLFNKVKIHVEESGPICSDVWIAVANGKPYEERPFCEFKFDKDQLKEIVNDAIDEYLRKEEFADFGPHGEWQVSGDDYTVCPFCKAEYDHFPKHSKFCGECGATMDGIKHV